MADRAFLTPQRGAASPSASPVRVQRQGRVIGAGVGEDSCSQTLMAARPPLLPHDGVIAHHLDYGRSVRQRHQLLGRPRLKLPVVFHYRRTCSHATCLRTRCRASHRNSAEPSRAVESPLAASVTASPPRPCRGSRSSHRASQWCAAGPAVVVAAGRARSAPMPGPSEHLNIGILAEHDRGGRYHSRASFLRES